MESFRWKEYPVDLTHLITEMYENVVLTDCELDSEGGLLKAHRVILAACSPYFKNLLMNHHEVTFSVKGIKYADMKYILDFMYYGQVDIPIGNVASFIKAAQFFQVASFKKCDCNFSENFPFSHNCEVHLSNNSTHSGEDFDEHESVRVSQKEKGIILNCINTDSQTVSFAGEKIIDVTKHLSEVGNNLEDEDSILKSTMIKKEIMNDDEENLEDVLNPISFISVAPFSEKVTEHDGRIICFDSELKNPLELKTEPTMQMDYEEEINACELHCPSTQDMSTSLVPQKGFDTANTPHTSVLFNELSVQMDENPVIAPELTSGQNNSSVEKSVDLDVKFVSICDISKHEITAEKLYEKMIPQNCVDLKTASTTRTEPKEGFVQDDTSDRDDHEDIASPVTSRINVMEAKLMYPSEVECGNKNPGCTKTHQSSRTQSKPTKEKTALKKICKYEQSFNSSICDSDCSSGNECEVVNSYSGTGQKQLQCNTRKTALNHKCHKGIHKRPDLESRQQTLNQTSHVETDLSQTDCKTDIFVDLNCLDILVDTYKSQNAEAGKCFPILHNGPTHDAVVNNYYGSLVVSEFKLKKELSERSRCIVADLVLTNEIKGDLNKKISQERFLELAADIAKYFPGEKETRYYLPYFKDQFGKKHSASGKLIDKLYNCRRNARSAGVIVKRVGATVDCAIEGPTTCADEETVTSLQWLSVTYSPWQECEKKWRQTHSYRRQELESPLILRQKSKKLKISLIESVCEVQRDTSLRIKKYLAKYCGLKEVLGHRLLELDFSLRYPGRENKLLLLWRSFKQKIIEQYKLLPEKVKSDANLHFLKGNDITDAQVLMSLSMLVKPKNIKNDNSRTWRPTREVIQDGFLIHIVNAGDVPEVMRELQMRAAASKETIQPFAVIVGSSTGAIDASYSCVGDVLYKVDSPVRAVDVTFKIFHALHAPYPMHAEPLWLLLQLCVYGFRTNRDNLREVRHLSNLIPKLSVV